MGGFTWTDSFNGLTGGIAVLSSDIPADPTSGDGGITILTEDGTAVPEPSTIVLLLAGWIFLCVLRSREPVRAEGH